MGALIVFVGALVASGAIAYAIRTIVLPPVVRGREPEMTWEVACG